MLRECKDCIDNNEFLNALFRIGCECEEDKLCIHEGNCECFNVKIGKSDFDKYVQNMNEVSDGVR